MPEMFGAAPAHERQHPDRHQRALRARGPCSTSRHHVSLDCATIRACGLFQKTGTRGRSVSRAAAISSGVGASIAPVAPCTGVNFSGSSVNCGISSGVCVGSLLGSGGMISGSIFFGSTTTITSLTETRRPHKRAEEIKSPTDQAGLLTQTHTSRSVRPGRRGVRRGPVRAVARGHSGPLNNNDGSVVGMNCIELLTWGRIGDRTFTASPRLTLRRIGCELNGRQRASLPDRHLEFQYRLSQRVFFRAGGDNAELLSAAPAHERDDPERHYRTLRARGSCSTSRHHASSVSCGPNGALHCLHKTPDLSSRTCSNGSSRFIGRGSGA